MELNNGIIKKTVVVSPSFKKLPQIKTKYVLMNSKIERKLLNEFDNKIKSGFTSPARIRYKALKQIDDNNIVLKESLKTRKKI